VRIAVISDIHGNLDALEAVLADVQSRGVDLIANLGDMFSGPLFPNQCADRLIPLRLPTIRGNHERQLLSLKESELGQSDRYAAGCLRPHHFSWIAELPEKLWLSDDVLLVHGTPQNDASYFLETVEEDGVRPASAEEIQSRAEGIRATLILCGHSHLQRSVRLEQGPLIVNPGSVGLPAYEDHRPFLHKMQSGTPHARYAIVERRSGDWSAELMTVLYDWEKAAITAESRGRTDWARSLRSGLA
jgi:predicted phosphodiesterase